jgi:YYY domain-containing protein
LLQWLAWTAALVLLPLALMLLVALALLLAPGGRDFLESIRTMPYVYPIVGDAPWPQVMLSLLAVKLRTWLMPLTVGAMAAMGILLLRHSVTAVARRTDSATALTENGGESPTEDESGVRTVLANSSIRFVLLCAVAGLLLTLSVEFVYLVDVFRVRMNTIFKFYFQAWVLMALATGFAVYWLGRDRSRFRMLFLVGFWVLFAMGMVYPVLGNISRAGAFAQAPSLDGTAYLAEGQPADYAATTWMNESIPGAPVILEAPGSGGSSYVYEGRVSALTGLPTLLGWAGHEGQWRGSYDIQNARDPDIATIYNTHDRQIALTLLGNYGISYVYVGPLEKSLYDRRGLEKFKQMLDVVYEHDGVTIYKVPR